MARFVAVDGRAFDIAQGRWEPRAGFEFEPGFSLVLKDHHLAIGDLDRTGLYCLLETFGLSKVDISETFLAVDLAAC